MSLKETLSTYWLHIQEELLPWLNETVVVQFRQFPRELMDVTQFETR